MEMCRRQSPFAVNPVVLPLRRSEAQKRHQWDGNYRAFTRYLWPSAGNRVA
jgi:hypothetical protein